MASKSAFPSSYNQTGGNRDWSNPREVYNDGPGYANVSLKQNSHRPNNLNLSVPRLQMDIPHRAVWQGFQVDIDRCQTINEASKDGKIILTRAGNEFGPNKAKVDVWPLDFEVATYGGPDDKWGLEREDLFDESGQIQSGLALRIGIQIPEGKTDEISYRIRSVKFTIYYTIPGFWVFRDGAWHRGNAWPKGLPSGTVRARFSRQWRISDVK